MELLLKSSPPPSPPESALSVLPHGSGAPSSWITRHAPLIAGLADGARVLDLACGAGRHARWLAAQGARVTAVDRDAAALGALAGAGLPGIGTLEADLEPPEGAPWPLAGLRFDAVVITNYLWRPRLDEAVALLAPGGVLLHETFAQGHARFGRPSRPDFLLRPGELLELARRHGLTVVAYEDGVLSDPPRRVQRIAAVRETDAPGVDRSADGPLHPLPSNG